MRGEHGEGAPAQGTSAARARPRDRAVSTPTVEERGRVAARAVHEEVAAWLESAGSPLSTGTVALGRARPSQQRRLVLAAAAAAFVLAAVGMVRSFPPGV